MEYEVKVCKREDGEYPKLFDGLNGMPERFYYAGDVGSLNAMRGVAIIGSRQCSEEALALAREAGRLAAEAGISIINGLALGVIRRRFWGRLKKAGNA